MRRQRGGRAAKRSQQDNFQEQIVPYIKREIPVFKMAGEEVMELIEENADSVLEEVGIEFRDDPEAISLWKSAGADVQGELVHFPRGLCRKLIQATAPHQYTQHARNSHRNVEIGGNHLVLAPAYGPPFIRNLDEGRRYATIEDFRNFVKLTYLSPGLHHSGGTVCEPVDLPVNTRHLEMLLSHFLYSDKPLMGSVTAANRAEDSVAMAKIVFGDDFVNNNCVLTSLINVNSPLTFDDTMLGAAKVYARNNQATIISPFILSGAMSPVSIVGTLTIILAEALAGLAFIQLVRPGAPCIFGTFGASTSMQSGAPTFGTSEPSRVLYLAAELARRVGVPFRSGGSLTGSKIPDAQAAYESANTMQAAALAGVNFMLHAAGWLEGGLAMGYEKFIMDADQAQLLPALLAAIDISENGQAMDAIHEVGPGSHFLGCAHTKKNFKTAFVNSIIADNNSFEQWQADGSQDASVRANKLYKKMLNNYQQPDIDMSIAEGLQSYVEKTTSLLATT